MYTFFVSVFNIEFFSYIYFQVSEIRVWRVREEDFMHLY